LCVQQTPLYQDLNFPWFISLLWSFKLMLFKMLLTRLALWVRILLSRWFSLGTPVSSTNKTDHHDRTEILLKVALNTINLTQPQLTRIFTDVIEKILYITIICISFPQIPRYIITLHELLAHTPHDHVERQSLEYAKGKLEELSRVCVKISTECIIHKKYI
jgi:hypothetical protein